MFVSLRHVHDFQRLFMILLKMRVIAYLNDATKCGHDRWEIVIFFSPIATHGLSC